MPLDDECTQVLRPLAPFFEVSQDDAIWPECVRLHEAGFQERQEAEFEKQLERIFNWAPIRNVERRDVAIAAARYGNFFGLSFRMRTNLTLVLMIYEKWLSATPAHVQRSDGVFAKRQFFFFQMAALSLVLSEPSFCKRHLVWLWAAQRT